MKSFIISCCTLLLVFTVIILNYFYVLKICKYMIKEASETSVSDVNNATSLFEYWKKRRIYIALSVPHRVSDELEKNLLIFISRAQEGTKSTFEESRNLLVNSIEEVKIHAGISADTVF